MTVRGAELAGPHEPIDVGTGPQDIGPQPPVVLECSPADLRPAEHVHAGRQMQNLGPAGGSVGPTGGPIDRHVAAR